MQFKKGENFQSSDAQLIWNKISSFNSGFKSTKTHLPKVRCWSWGQIVGNAVADFNKSSLLPETALPDIPSE